MSNKKAIGYRRVSSRDQIQGTGLDRQSTYIKKFAVENAFDLKRIFTEKGISGVVEKRPAFSELERSTLSKRMIAGRDLQRETGKRKGKKIKTVDRNGKIKIEGSPRLSEKQPKLAKRVIELWLAGNCKNKIATIVNSEGFRSRVGNKLYSSQITNILKDYELGLINTTKSRRVEEYQDG